jgi:UDP-N-acetylglucosamine:LPS N-acetylglucosamine transferase
MKVLVAPLDWGLGHATRCIPVIKKLISEGDELFIASEGKIEKLLKKEFPDVTFVFLKGYRIHYSASLPMILSIILQFPKLAWRIFREHNELKKMISRYGIDMVISDNRYGLWNRKIHSVFITHQVMIKCPPRFSFLEPALYRINKFFITKYNECRIPDDAKNMTGDLSHRYPLPHNATYTGTLSRWTESKKSVTAKKYDVIGIVSGPEPHRSSFEKLLTEQLLKSGLNGLLVAGKPEEKHEKKISNRLTMVSHLESKKLLEAIASSRFVVCRSGYSSIMDMAAIGKNAILVPTPGQTEQIYLADFLKKRNIFFSMEQKEFQLKEAIVESAKYSVKNLPSEKNTNIPPVTQYQLLFQE